jgi:phosphotransferase system enzyme I (PtsI)
MSRELKGVSVAPGIAIAPVVHFRAGLDFVPTRSVLTADLPREEARYQEAVKTAIARVTRLRDEIAVRLSPKDAAIFEAHIAILKDPGLHEEVLALVRRDRLNPEVALQRVVARYAQMFATINEAVLRERAADVRDVGRQILAALMEEERHALTGGSNYIFAAEEFLPGDAVLLDRARIKGIVTEAGGKYSHGAILARSFGIPCVVGIHGLMLLAPSGTTVILDGERGTLHVAPEDQDVVRSRTRIEELQQLEQRLSAVRALPARTRDGLEVQLYANVDGVRDLERVLHGFAGVGLFRTEFVFMERREFPSEEEQYRIYAEALRKANGLPVVFRTLDIGGDKPLAYFQMPQERNPVLGWRGIRLTFEWPDLLYTQLRAILRASVAGNARVMLPMVATIEEVRRGREVIEQLKADLRGRGLLFDPKLPFGVMIEVPSAVMLLPEILREVDFVSVGTNDLVQYLLAVDRDNQRVASMYDPYHPAVFRVLEQIARRCIEAGKPVSICGEIAGDHAMTPALIGLGFTQLSMAPVFLSRVKLVVTENELGTCRQLARQCLAADSATVTRALLRQRAGEVFEGRHLGM